MRIVRNAEPPAPPTRAGWPELCALPLSPDDLPEVEWVTYVEEGLGDAVAGCVELEGGWVVGFVRYLLGSWPHLTVVAFTAQENLAAVLAALLDATGLTEADLPWVSPDVRP
ncbi:MAG TPA: hypothetical protein VF519_04160 [Mycobacteriales bacterium]